MSEASQSLPEFTIWIVSDGRRGIENQALGLAEAVTRALGVQTRIERATVRKDGFVTLPAASHPDLWIGCGRAAVKVARKHRRIFSDTFFVYVQDPRSRYDTFDLIVAPEHDRLARGNVLTMTGSPNRITRAQLDAARTQFATRIDTLPSPRAAVLVGGASKRFRITPEIGDYLERRIAGLVERGLGVMVTVSRRTPEAVRQALAARFAEDPRVWFFDGEGENPYFAFLASADWIFVTEESTNMILEAAATGRPVYLLAMAGKPGKFSRLHAALEARGHIRPFLGELDTWTSPPLAETDRIARALIERWRPEPVK
ncbi:MAG: mitochondrial fission ELM1 family protein [Pseudomonadota bacterium]|nr:mitochondrial fission ELM1 family protein [Pseudomonadota bacterium]